MSTRRRGGDDFAREIAAHIDIETDRLIEEGMAPADARAAARRRFGNVTTARERFYETGRLMWLDHAVQDLRGASRSIRRYPVAAFVAVLSLAAGIGATTVTLTIRDVVFRKPPLLYVDPESLSRIQVGRPERPIMPLGSPVPAPVYLAWRDSLGMPIAAAMEARAPREVTVESRQQTATVRVSAVTPNLFALLGVPPAAGRGLSGGGDGPPEAVISYAVWQRIFDGRPDAIGATVLIDHRAHTIVGVMPQQFWFATMDTAVWTPLADHTLAPADHVDVVIRRPAGMTAAMLDARLQAGLAEFARRQPAGEREWRLNVSDLRGSPVGHQVAIVLPYVLGTCVLLTLLIACANVAVLMIAQWTAREHEIAIRASIGGSRGRIVRALLAESVLIALLGGAAGVAATSALRGWIVHRAGTNLSQFDLSIDPFIFLWAAAVTVCSGLVAGIAPALYETRRLQGNPLRSLATPDRVRQRWRHALVVMEITVTVALLVVTTAMIDGYNQARAPRLGYDTRPLIVARVERTDGVAARELLERLAAFPGVAAVAASGAPPHAAGGTRVPVATDGAGANATPSERIAISPGFFSTLGVPLRSGRTFAGDESPAAATAIVNETLAARLFGARPAIGAHVWIAGTRHEVVGVAADYSNNPLHPSRADAKVFLPLPAAADLRRAHLVVRASTNASALVEPLRRGLAGTGGGLEVVTASTIDNYLRVVSQELLVGTAPLFPLIAIGMLLTACGIYGVLSFAITRRSRELAVRMAIGASSRDIVRLVTAHTVRLVAVGSLLGIAVTYVLARIVRAAGGAGTVFDPETTAFVVPIVILLAIGAVATWLPSRRATKIDPAVLLRST